VTNGSEEYGSERLLQTSWLEEPGALWQAHVIITLDVAPISGSAPAVVGPACETGHVTPRPVTGITTAGRTTWIIHVTVAASDLVAENTARAGFGRHDGPGGSAGR
jgi:hypothetical protein